MVLMSVRRLGFVRVLLAASCAVLSGLGLLAVPAGAVSLPDGRVYEAVSPVETEGLANVFVPFAATGYMDINGERGGIQSAQQFQVAPDGESVIYAGDAPPTEGGTGGAGLGSGDEYQARRSPGGGWTQVDLQPTGGFGVQYEAFSNDLSVGILNSGEPLATGASPGTFYSRATPGGDYRPIYAGIQSFRTKYAGANGGTSAVSAMSHLLFAGEEALLEGNGQLEEELREEVSKRVEEGKRVNVLYDSTGGRLSLVSVLPNGKVDADATFGSPSLGEHEADLGHTISADGSRIFWTALNDEGQPEALYVRQNDASPEATSVQADAATVGAPGADGGGRFLTVSGDGSKVFFTDESRLTSDSTAAGGAPDLYEYDVEGGALTDLTVDEHAGEHANVQGVAGVSEDGSYVYFVADGALASGAVPQVCEDGNASTSCNLYVRHDGVTKFVVTLSPADNDEIIPFDGEGDQNHSGDWQADLRNRTAEVTPDGHSLLFTSERSLTGYDSVTLGYHNEVTTTLDELFLYEDDSGKLTCVSCDPSGEAPVSTDLNFYHGPSGGFFPQSSRKFTIGNTSQPQVRVISDDGSRVFFDSGEPLVSQDNNGWVDVYEWERDGAGSCQESAGCVYLLSGGTNPENSFLIGSSATGGDVFITTRSQLAAQEDRNDNLDLYDVRVGGVQPPATAACAGAGCQGVPPAPPIFATPSSVTFNGVGNFSPPASTKPAVKRKVKSKPIKCKRNQVKKKRRCVRKSRAKAKKSAKGRK
jgi:hypothetical protein